MIIAQFKPDGSFDVDATIKLVRKLTLDDLDVLRSKINELERRGRCSVDDAIKVGGAVAMRQVDLSIENIKVAQRSFDKIFNKKS